MHNPPMAYDISLIQKTGEVDTIATRQFDLKSMQELLGNLLYYLSESKYTVETEQTYTTIGSITQTVTVVTITNTEDGTTQIMHTYELEKGTDTNE